MAFLDSAWYDKKGDSMMMRLRLCCCFLLKEFELWTPPWSTSKVCWILNLEPTKIKDDVPKKAKGRSFPITHFVENPRRCIDGLDG
jgi:hypothetical protein